MANIISADIVRVALSQMKLRPCLDIYHGDWIRDDIAGCSLRAQGFWFRAMFVMHDAKPYGHLVGAAGEPLNDPQIMKRCGVKSRSELNQIRSEIELVGVPGLSGDSAYYEILRDADAVVTIRGTEWQLDLSPLRVSSDKTVYSRRMLRDRRLSLMRFFVSPKGQLLIPQTKDLTTQMLSPRARVGAEDEKEEDSRSLSQVTKNPEGVQGEGTASTDFDAVVRLMPKLIAAGFEYPPSEQMVIAWLGNFDEKLIVETLADCEGEYRGKTYRYFEKILVSRRDDPSKRPNHRLKGNGNGRSRDASGSSRQAAPDPPKPRRDYGHRNGYDVIRELEEKEKLSALPEGTS